VQWIKAALLTLVLEHLSPGPACLQHGMASQSSNEREREIIDQCFVEVGVPGQSLSTLTIFIIAHKLQAEY
jgi:hypothetical protein